MQTLWPDHSTAADNPPATPPKPTVLRSSAADNPPPPPRSERRLVCPKCNAWSCPLLTSSPSAKFPRRHYYACRSSSRDHKFFKWADEVSPEELVDVPECGGCKAGPCRVRRETTGPDAGRVLFMCTVKEGQGSCGYKVWQDELQKLTTSKANERIVSSQSTRVNCKETGTTITDLVEESRQCPPTLVDTPQPLQYSTLLVQDNTPVSPRDPITLTRSFLGVESYNKPLLNPCNNAVTSAVGPLHIALDVPSYREIKHQNAVSKSSISGFNRAADLQNDLFTRLESMDANDHVAMSEAAEATFSELDRLLFDGRDFKERVKHLIHCAMSLAEIEQSMARNNSSHHKLIEKCSSKRKRLEEINHKQIEVIDTLTKQRKYLNDLDERLFQLEAERSCHKVEITVKENEQESISKEKELSEGDYLIALKELEDSEKFRQGEEAERDAAEAALGNARVSIRR